ncbi:MAG: CDP-diacylglycerol--glycerol-3-phosphate 3-phosphatidyltransferase [candidate division Zixibacteria bacterium RBG_16_53_22]|nr:MAG: CDP-diacylglycerol--glycerol-3-phosphate 3-phosphatidyltransferase [candidate division Zixibacteria bacterium RBG_16_53_22]
MNIPNLLTIARILLSPVFMVLIIFENFYARLAATIVFIIAALTDLADGYYARKLGHPTGFGRFMDPLADKILVSTAFLSFVSLGYARGWMVMIIIVREFLITGLRSMAAYRGMVISPSVLAKWKTVSQMLAIAIILVYANVEPLISHSGPGIPSWIMPWTGWNYNLFDLILVLPLILTLWTGIDYLFKSGGLLKGVLG